jgi:hypothetical protein
MYCSEMAQNRAEGRAFLLLNLRVLLPDNIWFISTNKTRLWLSRMYCSELAQNRAEGRAFLLVNLRVLLPDKYLVY